jgi:hypothetical protein
MSKVLEAYIGKAARPAKPTRGRTAQPPRALAQHEGMVAYLGCCSVAPATRQSVEDWTSMNVTPHVIINY